MSQSSIKVVVITDIPEALIEINQRFAHESDIEIIGSTTAGEEALALVTLHQPDIVVMDYDMPGIDGAEATRAILREDERSMVIMLSVVNDAGDIRHAMRAGARDYLVKPLSEGELVATIRWLIGERREYARMQAFVGQMRKAYEALFMDDQPVPENVLAYLEEQAKAKPEDRLILESLAVAYARNREWAKLMPLVATLAET